MKILDGIEKKQVPLNFECQFCGKGFVKASTFQVHVCEKKRRHFARDDKNVKIAYSAYVRFYELTMPNSTKPSYEDFSNGPYYTAFVKFGSFMINTSPIYPERFIDYVIKSGTRLDKWCRDDLYEKYVSELIKIEPADSALERTIKSMMKWGDINKTPWEHYFKYVNNNRATHDVLEGFISPWVILNCNAGKDMLARLTDEQLDIISLVIDPSFWMKRFKELPADVVFVKEVIKEAKLR